MYGLTDEELRFLQTVFAQNEKIRQVKLYGSRAKGCHKPFSDVDLTLIGHQLTHDDLTTVSEQLASSSLPYAFDVSLYNNLSNPALLSHIQRIGKIIYTADTAETTPLP